MSWIATKSVALHRGSRHTATANYLHRPRRAECENRTIQSQQFAHAPRLEGTATRCMRRICIGDFAYVPEAGSGPNEVGVFYYRFPDESRGRIFAITEKVFPVIVGDGVHTVEELVWADTRARLLADKYLARLENRRNEILPMGETLKLVEAGNHAQGCIFRDGMHLCSEELEHRIDEISQRLNGFFIGRYDIRYASPADLRAGRNFKIIELNGAASEATSIYDARNSLWSAYRTLFRQWELVFSIGAANRRRGSSPTALNLLWRAWRRTAALTATYPTAD